MTQADTEGAASTGNGSHSGGIVQNAKATSETAPNAVTENTTQPTAPSTSSIPQAPSADAAPPKYSSDESSQTHPAPPAADVKTSDSKPEVSKDGTGESLADEAASHPSKAEVAPPAPRVWADLLKSASVANKTVQDGQIPPNGTDETHAASSLGPSQPTTKLLADVLKEYNPSNGKVFFIEPRGLYNARVDCYMISVSCT